MKKCPFCHELVQNDAKYCPNCGADLRIVVPHPSSQEQLPWYFRKMFIAIAVLSVGPLALPLIWFHPQTTRAWKIGLTIAILVLSWFLYLATLESLRTIKQYYKLMEGL
jgi:hypothetical protein